MNKHLLSFFLCILLAIVSSFGLNTMIRLHNASNTFPTKDSFNDATHLSKKYVQGGLIIYGTVLTLSIIGIVMLSVKVYRKN